MSDIFMTLTGIVWGTFYLLMKIELSARNLEKDYMLGHHFSFFPEYYKLYLEEKDKKKKKNTN